MTLTEAVAYYHSLEKFGIKPGLERVSLLCDKLGSPHKKLKFIHVAGTNGKGSTCTAIASVLTAAGFRTGLYTSPFVSDFRERIRLDMEMISPQDLIEITEKVSFAVSELAEEGVEITEFEAVTAAAMLFYSSADCDFVVLETGLGGRFDATNIIENPICSVITSVSLDHTGILGNTLTEIAFEKCGIIKKDSPVVTGSGQAAEVLEVISSSAAEKNAPLILVDRNDLFSVKCEDISKTVVEGPCGQFCIPYCGSHQLENMALVFGVIDVLRNRGAEIGDGAVCSGISSFRIPARTEIICEKPLVILDGSHNDGSTAALADAVKKHLAGKKILAVMGMMKDKDYNTALSNLAPCFSEIITVKPSNPRSLDAEALAEAASRFSVDAVACEVPEEGIDLALNKIKDFDVLIVCGSLYLAGDIREYLVNKCGTLTAEE